MKKKLSTSLPSLFRLICILIISLFQLPAVALGFDFREFKQTEVLPTTSEANLPNQNNDSSFVVFSNAGSISITDRASGTSAPNGISSPYPSTIAVSGLSGTISDINVTISGITTARPRDIDFAIVSPTGQAFLLMSDTGDLTATSNVNLTFDDAAANQLPTGTSSVIVSGTFRPTDFVSGIANNDVFPAPGPATLSTPAPNGTATLASVFNGLNPNGTWSLYAIDDSLGGGNSTISGGWSIDITTAGGTAPTTTTVTSTLNPSLTTQTVTFPATVTSSGNPVTSGNVSFTQNGNAITGCSNINLNGSGQAVCTANAGTLPEGTLNIVANYNGNASFGASNGSLSQTVISPTVVTGAQFCNNGGLAFPDTGAASVYPSNITVSNMTGTISKVTVQLNGLTVPRAQDLDFLVVGPGGQAFQIMSDVGNVTAISNVNLTLDDTAANQMPIGTTLVSGTFRPTDQNVVGLPDTFPAPAPGTFSQAAPAGASTFASVFNGLEPNGNWRLFSLDDGLGGGASGMTNWCLNFTLNKFSTTTAVTSSLNPAPQGQNVTFTATVTASSPFNEFAPGTPTGSVEFFDGVTSLGTGVLNGAGQATLTTSTLPQGARSITAQYLGANVGAGGGGYANSTSTILTQTILAPVAANVSVAGRVLTSDGRGVSKAVVTMVDSQGVTRSALTNPFGYFRFTDVEVGSSYFFSIKAKNHVFADRVVAVEDEVVDLEFIEESP